jgi:hypothetical protein
MLMVATGAIASPPPIVSVPSAVAQPIVPFIRQAHFMVIDKRTARRHEYTIQEGRSFTHESLQVQVRQCWNEADGVMSPEQAALVEMREQGGDQTSDMVFSGWMFVNKSELSNLQHQAYDVTLLSCAPPVTAAPVREKQTDEGLHPKEDVPVDESAPSD